MAKIESVFIDYTKYKCSSCEDYYVVVSYKSGVRRSYTVDSYEKIPCTVRTFIEINKSSEYSWLKHDDLCVFHVLREYYDTISSTPEYSNNTPETEDDTSEVTAPAELPEKSDDVPETENEHQYIEKLNAMGIELTVMQKVTDFMSKMKDMFSYTGDYYAKSFTKFMNNDSDDPWTSVYGCCTCLDDISLFIEYNDGTEFSLVGGMKDGKFKQTGIKSCIYSDAYEYIVFNYDMEYEFENYYEEEYMIMLEEQMHNDDSNVDTVEYYNYDVNSAVVIEDDEPTPEVPAPVEETEKPDDVPETLNCAYCSECVYYEKCSVNAPYRMKCRHKCLSCGMPVCCADFHSRKSIDDIYEEQKRTETLSTEISIHPTDIPFDMRIKHLCRICKHLKKCFYRERSKVLEYYDNHEYCGDVCGECTACCSHFKQDFKEICVNCRSCIHFRKCLDSDKVYWCYLDSDSPYHCFACETDSNIECIGKYLDCYQNEFEYFDYSELETEEVINDGDLPF